MKIVIVEDDPGIRKELKQLLENAFYEAEIIEEFKNTAEQICSMIPAPDLVLLDWNLPGESGFDICTKLKEHSDIPIIFLTSRTDSMDELTGILKGADDYITKPFNILEVKARIKAILRRSAHHDVKEEESAKVVESRGLKIDCESRRVHIHGKEVNLTAKEFDLLELLVFHPNKVYSREDLLNTVWGYDYPGDARTVDVHIRSLRQKLGECGKLIETVRGIGYRIGGNES